MSQKSELQQYKDFVKQKLDEITTCLAYISVGDFARRFNLYELEDNEFAEAFCGLDLMMDDLVETREELQDINKNLHTLVQERTSELETEKERLAITLRSIAEGVITTDTAGSIQLMNKTAEEITGWSFAEAKGKPLHTVFTLDDESNSVCCPHAKDSTSIPEKDFQNKEEEILLKTRNNSTMTIFYSLSPIIDHTDDTIIGKIIVFRDIEEKKRTESELLRMKKLESVGILAGGIAHDFNNILTGIISSIQLAQYGSLSENETKELLKDAEHASLRAVNLTKQLLTFSKGGAPVRENASLSELINESVKFCLSGTNVTADLSVPSDLWLAHVDKGQMNQVLNNIILNAVQAMSDGGTISVSSKNIELVPGKHNAILLDNLKPGKYIEITLADSGAGIGPAYIDKIFDPYFTTKKKGSGLGLTIAYSIVKKHNGHITVASNQNGSTFTLYLPANPSAKQPRSDTLKTKEKGDGSVLVMYDDSIVLKALEKLLARLGYRVTCVQNGEEALTKYQEKSKNGTPFSLVFLDLTVKGGMGGKETIKALRKLDDKIKVIVMSGYSNDPIISNYRAYGFDGVIPKPFTISELNSVITDVVAV